MFERKYEQIVSMVLISSMGGVLWDLLRRDPGRGPLSIAMRGVTHGAIRRMDPYFLALALLYLYRSTSFDNTAVVSISRLCVVKCGFVPVRT